MAKHLKKHNSFLALFAASAMILPGCGLADATQTACIFTGNDPHCEQEAAVQTGNADNCDRVEQKEEFKKIGSNPPRDKCVSMVAANNEEPATCDKVKGGPLSYSKEDCMKGIADTARDPDTCSKFEKPDMASCVNGVAQKAIEDGKKLEKMASRKERDIKELQEKMNKIQKLNEMLSGLVKTQFDTQRQIVNNLR